MTTTSILWTALPNGGDDRAFKLSLYVSPRLEGGGPTGLLEDYALGNWTKTVAALLAAPGGLQLELSGPGSRVLPLAVDKSYVDQLSPELWDRLFPADATFVSPRVFQDHGKRWIRSYSIHETETFVQRLYDTIAEASPNAFPDLKGTTPITRLTDLMGRAFPIMERALPRPREPGQGKQKSYEPVPQQGRATHPDAATETLLANVAAGSAPDVPLAELFRAYRFYNRGNHQHYRSKDAPRVEAFITDRPQTPKFDFHKTLAALGDHPFLLRKLGLVVDVVLQAPAELLRRFARLQVVPAARPPVLDLTPYTKHMVSAVTGFRTGPRKGGDLAEGMLRLDDPKAFEVIQTDPDGNVIKVLDYAINMHQYRGTLLAQKDAHPQAKTSRAPEETSVPALRSGGLMITRRFRDDAVHDGLVAQRGHESNPEAATLYAEDVLRGYRVDVSYRGKWHSLCRRVGKYEVAGVKLEEAGPAEGYVKAVSASSDPDQAPGTSSDLYVHEAIVGWRNWSLVAKQPGKTIVSKELPGKHKQEAIEHVDNAPAAGVPVAAEFRPERLSLAPLRFGEFYRMRARAVDLAGNSLAPPPSVVDKTPSAKDQAPSGVGETPPVRYLRYDPVPAPALVLTDAVRAGESVDTMVVRHRSTFGVPMGGSPPAFPVDAKVDEAKIFNDVNTRWVAAPKTTVGDAETHSVFDNLFKTPEAAFAVLQRESGAFDDDIPGATKILDVDGKEVAYPPTLDWKKGDTLPDGMYFVHTEDPVLLPYLPDPLARGVAVMPLDGSNAVLPRPFSGAWPDVAPFKLVLEEGTGAASFDLTGNPAKIKLPRGTMLRLRYSSFIVPPDAESTADLDLMGRWASLSAAGKAKTEANGYQHWMLTPWRSLTLVNAVEKPLAAPQLLKMANGRGYGETFVRLRNGTVDTHSHSTGEIELRGRWTESVDDPLDGEGWKTVEKEGHVLDRKVDYDEKMVQIPPPNERTEVPRHEFGDTKHRTVKYRAIGTTRYREYFPPELTGYEDPVTRRKVLITAEGGELAQNVLSSARPLPPEPLYIVPTFKWQDTATGRQRLGRGLRIYLKRGWFSSGEGELLGVVLMPSGSVPAQTAETLRDYVSLWGADPIFDRTGPTATLAPSHFDSDPAHPKTQPGPLGTDVLLAESNLRVRVQGYAPLWDPVRKLWYVDVTLKLPQAYNTFVRFALCRYQPDSLPDVEISKVVKAEFAQLLPDRNAALSHGPQAIEVTLAGQFALSKLGHRWNGDLSGDPPVIFGGHGQGIAQTVAGGAAKAGGGRKNDIKLPPVVELPPVVQPPIVLPPRLISSPAAGSAHLVVAQLEWREMGAEGDLGWQPLDGGQRLTPYTALQIASDGNVYWRGTVRWPRSDAPPGRDYRLVLREYEIYQTDGDVAEPLAIANPTGVPVRSRLVYTDVFPVTTAPRG